MVNKGKIELVILMLCGPQHREEQALYRENYCDRLPPHVRFWFVEGRIDSGVVNKVLGDVLYVPCEEAYENLGRKVALAISYCVNEVDFSYLFKCDANTYVNIDKLLAYPFQGKDYIGAMVAQDGYNPHWHFGKCKSAYWNINPNPSPHHGSFAAGGVGYFLSKSSATLVAEHAFEHCSQSLTYEDKMVGDILRDHNVVGLDDPESFDLRREKYRFNPHLITRKTRDVNQLRELFKTQGN